MKMRVIAILGILIVAVMLAACTGPSAAQPAGSTTTASGPSADQTPGGRGPGGFSGTPGGRGPGGFSGTPGGRGPGGFSGTPGGQRPGGGANNPSGRATAQAGASAQPVPTVAGSANVSGAPTAVPIPSIVIPTSIPASQASNNSAATPVSVPTASSAPAPMVTAAPASGAPAPSIQDLKGKILFFSDRGGGYSQLYVMNADGSNQQLCNCSDLLQTIVNNETVSPDKQQFLFIKTVGSARGGDIQIWRHNNANNTDEPLTGGAPGFPGVDYDPVWSPDSKHIAWVTEVNHYDEIYLYDASQNSNVRLTQSSGEWYKHPSFSPDGSHITYWTNLGNLTYKQIWQMNLDGSGQTNLSSNSYNDWDPIWVK